MTPGFHHKMFSKRFHSSLALSIRLFCTLIFTFLWFSSALNAAEPPTIELTLEEQAWAEANPELVNISSALRSRVQLSDQERRWLETKQDVPVRVGDYPPFFFVSNDSPQGLSIDYVRMICSAFDMNCRFVTGIPVSESFSLMQEPGGIALQPAWQSNAEREKIAIFTTPYLISPFVIFKRKEETDPIRSMEDLAGKRVVVEKGYAIHRLLEQKHPELKLVEVKFSSEALETLSTGGADAYISSMLAGNYMAIQQGIPNVEVAAQTQFKPNIMSIAVRRDHPELASLIDKSIKAITPLEHTTIKQRWTTGFEGTFSPPPVRVSLTPEEKAWLAQQHLIRVTFSEHPPYFSFKGDKVAGIAVEYLEKISRITGIEFQIANEPYLFTDELRGLLDKSGPDVITAIMPTEEREKVILFTKPFIQSPRFIFTRDDAPFISKIEDLFGKTVAVIKDYVTHKYLLEFYPDIGLKVYGTNEEALRAVSTRKAFAYIGDLTSTPVAINQFGLQNLKAACPSGLPDHSLAMGVRNDWPELRNILDKALDVLPAEEKAAIINKWSTVRVEYGIRSSDIKKWGLVAVLSLLSIITIFTTWNKQLSRRVAQRTAELSDSEARFRATFEQAAVGIAHVSPDGRFIRLNQKFCEIVGYSEKEVLKLKFQDITHPDDLGKDLELFQELLDGKSDSYTMEKRYIRKDGSVVWINLTVKILRNEDGSPRWFVSVIEDISDRIRIQNEVHKSYEFLNHLTKTIPDAIFSVKLPERTVTWCTDTYGILGYKAQECIGESTEKLYPSPVEAQKMGALIDNAISNENETVQTEIMLRRKNGEIFPVEAKLAFQKEAGRVVNVTALLRDISERKLAEKKLQESHDYLKHLVSSIPDAVFRVKLPERVIDWVEDYSHIMGASDVKEMYGQPTRNYFASEDEYNAFGEIQRQTIENGKDFMRHEIIVRRSDGKTFPAEVTSSFFRENGTVKYVTALVRDITDRKEAEKKILDYQKHLKALASQLTLAEERERRRIAADLHDDIGQTLAMSRLQLAAAIRACDCTGSKHHGMLEEISATLLKAIQDTRQLIFELGSAAIHEIGLGAAIAEWIEEKMKSLDDEIDFDLVDNLADDMLEEDQRVILFRNIRELLTNTIKHARASKVEILLESDDHEIHITVQDDGIGFNPELISGEFNQEGGYGIFSIEERMADLGGRLEIDSAPHKGCCITMSLPIES